MSDVWGPLDEPKRRVPLTFEDTGKENVLGSLSAAVCSGDTLFFGGDEGAALERLRWDSDGWRHHQRLALKDVLDLADDGEADIEGLAEDDGWLWVVGSHARTRAKIKDADGGRIEAARFCDLRDTRARCLLARLPLVRDDNGALHPVRKDGVRRAGLLKQGKLGNALAKFLAADPLIGPFTKIAAKEGGVDVEGIAVAGSRVALGMRGPVVRSYAVLLEMEVTAGKSGRLKLGKAPTKRLLDLAGLGIRDLKRVGDDLLILAGPTTALDGPCTVYRWRGWLHDGAEDDGSICLHRPDPIIDLPFGRGDDHPEGLALIPNGAGFDLLVVCDSPAEARVDAAARTLTADVFRLPDPS